MPYGNYQPQPIQPKNLFAWVQGEVGAKAFQMSPNTIAWLMDSENDGKFYIKVCDNVGMSSIRYFEYKEIQSSPVPLPVDMSEYVKKDDLENMIKSIIGGMTYEQSVSTVKSPKTNTKQCKGNDIQS